MCGIAGYFLRQPSAVPAARIESLLEPLRARGPDDEGVCLINRASPLVKFCSTHWTVPPIAARHPHFRAEANRVEHDVALLHARFAIIDLSAGGHQPFVSADGSVIAVVHGEIYNYRELREELSALGVLFRTASDTEVLVEGYRIWRDDVWQRLNGFWAAALFDRQDSSVILCRDRFGVAPLYYRATDDGFYFASLIQPLLELQRSEPAIDVPAVAGFIETELKDFDASTCFADVRSLPPATALRFAPGAFTVEGARAHAFWTYPQRSWSVAEVPFDDAVERFRSVFLDAVALRLRADVPIAFELSGGLDSSSIAAAAAQQGKTLTTYTLKVPGSDEEPFARTLRQRYSLDYHVIERPEIDFFGDAAGFARVMEEPYHAPNVYTHFKLRQVMKHDGVRVVLAGSGGDEVLAGYEHDFWPQARAELLRTGRRWQALTCGARFKTSSWSRTTAAVRSELQRAKRSILGNGARQPARAHSAELTPALRWSSSYASLDFHGQRRYHLQVGLLPYYLRSDDHFSMTLPIEQRSPFLDYRVVELGLQLPAAYLFRRGWTKYILRKAMQPFLPREIVWRREKVGFPFPLRPFLVQHRAQLAAYLPQLAAAGLARGAEYDQLVRKDPQKLWRMCSTGIWLDNL